MLISGVLDVAIGMIFVYLILSLITSAANEVIEMKLKNRATDLEKGLRELLDPGKNAGESTLIQQIYNHPLINGLFEGTYEESGIKEKSTGIIKSTALPSYIPSKNFALALIDLAVRGKVETPGQPPNTFFAVFDRLAQQGVNVGGKRQSALILEITPPNEKKVTKYLHA